MAILLFCELTTPHRGAEVRLDSLLCDLALLLCAVAPLLGIQPDLCSARPVLLLSEADVGVPLDVEGEGNKYVANNGGNNTDDRRPFADLGCCVPTVDSILAHRCRLEELHKLGVETAWRLLMRKGSSIMTSNCNHAW